MRTATCMLLSSLISACCRRPPVETIRLDGVKSDAVYNRFWVFADSQLNNIAGAATETRTWLVDHFAHHAIRPPTVDLWSERVLSKVIDRMNREPGSLALFLGDASNTSCISEYERFLKLVDSTTWFGVPGNHDGYYFGNLPFAADGKLSPAENTWQGACGDPAMEPRGGDMTVGPVSELVGKLSTLETSLLRQHDSNAAQGTMTKAIAVWMYLNNLESRMGLSPSPWAGSSWKRDPPHGPVPNIDGARRAVYKGSGSYVADGQKLTYSVVAAVGLQDEPLPGAQPLTAKQSDERARSWQAYVTQDVELPGGAHVLLADTSDFLEPPSVSVRTCKLAGECGFVSKRQAASLNDMAERLAARNTPFFVAGHHNWGSLSRAGAGNLVPLVTKRSFIAYLSAHVHKPTSSVGYVSDATEGHVNKDYDWEVNVASILDTPMEFMRLGYQRDAIVGRRNLEVEVISAANPDDGDGCFLVEGDNEEQRRQETAEEMKYGRVEDYVARAIRVYSRLFEKVRSLGFAPKGLLQHEQIAKVTLGATRSFKAQAVRTQLAKLVEFDRKELGTVEAVATAEFQCAVWASRLEGAKNHAGHTVSGGHRFLPDIATYFSVRAGSAGQL